MDNYSPHLKEEVWAWARANNVKFYLTPSNASWLNRIECQFTGLKKFALGQQRLSESSRTGASHPEAFGLAQWSPRDSRRALGLVPPKKRPICPPCSSLKLAKLFNCKGH